MGIEATRLGARLALGTAQFGLDYGVANPAGRTERHEVARILELARANGIDLLDTAALYGQSEAVLGELAPAADFRVVTKTPHFEAGSPPEAVARQLLNTFQSSLDKLRRRRVYGLLTHRAADLLAPNGDHLWAAMAQLKTAECVEKIGVSVYTAAEIDALSRQFPLDIVQLPVNVFDQRLVVSGRISKLAEAGIEVHARSIFLQGLLLMTPSQLSDDFDPIRGHLQAFQAAAATAGMTPLAAALAFAQSLSGISVLLVGVDNVSQLRDIVDARGSGPEGLDWTSWALDEPRWVDPSRWRRV